MRQIELVEYLERVIKSCLTFEQLIVTEQWINKNWRDQDFFNYVEIKIRWKERELGKNNFGDSFNIITQRVH